MKEKEDNLPDPRPIQSGDEERIFCWVEQFVRKPHHPDYTLRDAPRKLVRRFLLRQPEGDEKAWIPSTELSDEVANRV